MPITLPPPATAPGPTPSSLSPDSDNSNNNILTSLKARVLRPPAFTTTREKSASAVVLLRAASNFVHFVLYALSRNPLWCLWPILDQLVIAYAVSFVADARGGRRVFGWGVEESFFDMFLGLCGVVHALYMFVLVICILSYAIFFGITGGFIMTIVGALILPVAWLASRPDDGEGSVSLP